MLACQKEAEMHGAQKVGDVTSGSGGILQDNITRTIKGGGAATDPAACISTSIGLLCQVQCG